MSHKAKRPGEAGRSTSANLGRFGPQGSAVRGGLSSPHIVWRLCEAMDVVRLDGPNLPLTNRRRGSRGDRP